MSRVPRIRFKGFKEDWEQRKLVSLCEKFTDGDWIEAKDQSHSGVRLIQTGNVGLGEYIDRPNNKKWISEETFVLLNCEEVLAGDILISRLPEPAGRACVVPKLGTKMVAAVDCTIARASTQINPKYLLQFLSSQSYFDEVNTCLAGGTRQRISRRNLADFDIPIPAKYQEQKAIGEFLFCIDHLITLHQSKSFVHILKVIAGYTLYWEQRKLGEIGSVAMCRRIFKYQTTESGDIPFFKIGSFGGTPDAFISKDLFESFKVKYPYPEKGDVLISASGSIGRTVVFTGKDEYFQDSNIVWLKHNNSIINSFLNYLYSTVKWAGIEGTTIKRLYNDNILKTEAIIPTLLEQQKISDYLDGINHLITLHQLEPFKLILKAIAYRIIDYAKSKPPRYIKYADLN